MAAERDLNLMTCLRSVKTHLVISKQCTDTYPKDRGHSQCMITVGKSPTARQKDSRFTLMIP